MTHAKPRIIAIGFDVHGTGLTRVVREILFPLGDAYDIHFLAIGYKGASYEDRGVTVYPTNLMGGDVFAAFQAREMIEALRPDIVFALHDLSLLDLYTKVFAPVRMHTCFIAYIPLDGAIINHEFTAALSGFDHAVSYTDWARNQLRSALDKLEMTEPGRKRPHLDVMFHGVDHERFHPSAELTAVDFHHSGRAALKRRLFPDLEDPEHTFIVLNANRPVFRKRLDLTLEGFALFAAGKPANVKLCLHQAHVDELTPHLLELASKHGLESRLLYNPLNPYGGAIPDEELNQLYGACDVGLNTSAGEGWGLVSFEHAATGGAQIVPLSTACTSLWTDQTALRIIPVDFAETPMSELELAYVDPVDVAAALERLYRDREHARILAKSGYEHVMHSQFQWSTISGQWRELFGTAVSRFRAETRVSE